MFHDDALPFFKKCPLLPLRNNLDEILCQAEQRVHHMVGMNVALVGGGDEPIGHHANPATG